MRLISREELKQKLDRGDRFKLVMALGEGAYRAKHIPGSLHCDTPEAALHIVSPEDEIVVYCSGPDCIASVYAFQFLESRGFTHLYRFAGGLLEWEAAGYPLEGELVQPEKGGQE